MALQVKPATQWKSNWEGAIARVPSLYSAGITANVNWHDAAITGQANYVTMMTDTAVLARREDGLRTKTSQSAWQAAAKDKGAARIGAGMTAGKPKYDASADRNYAVLSTLVLPDRTIDFRTNITNRVTPVVEALKREWGKL